MFLYNGFRFRFDVVEALLAKLRELYDIVYKLTSYRFFSSSLLIGYDGHPSSPSCCQESSPSTCGAASVTEHVDADSGVRLTCSYKMFSGGSKLDLSDIYI